MQVYFYFNKLVAFQKPYIMIPSWALSNKFKKSYDGAVGGIRLDQKSFLKKKNFWGPWPQPSKRYSRPPGDAEQESIKFINIWDTFLYEIFGVGGVTSTVHASQVFIPPNHYKDIVSSGIIDYRLNDSTSSSIYQLDTTSLISDSQQSVKITSRPGGCCLLLIGLREKNNPLTFATFIPINEVGIKVSIERTVHLWRTKPSTQTFSGI